ncbi:MAG: hypothetical protein L6R36_007983 [Xanthoria steineri]|nr:MAG: hypothetical protein L6R36_007983 [Xanthoria steineri]
MDDIPPSYEAATQHDYWTIIADYIHSSDDLCAASRVCKRWHQIYSPLLWGNPASHFGTENDRVYVALTRFKRSLRWVRSSVRSLTHTLHLPPAQAELYDGPHPGWLRDVLVKLPNLQSLLVSQLPFFDHASLLALRSYSNAAPAADAHQPSFPLRLLIATQCINTTQKSLADALLAFPNLVFLDLSRTSGARDAIVLSKLQHMSNLQILKLCGIQLRDDDLGVLSDAIGIRVRSLDVRNNLLTDKAVRTLLQSCFLLAEKAYDPSSRQLRDLSSATEEDWPSGALKPDPAVLDEFQDESFDTRYLRRLTHGLVSRMPSEDQAHAGITHLYISGNHLTVEGISSLIKSGRLHVLDAGAVDTARVFRGPSSSTSLPATNFHAPTLRLLGGEKLTLILAKYASKKLTSLRVDHSVVTKSTIVQEEKPKLETCELSSDTGLQELPVSSLAHELPVSSPVYELLASSPAYELPQGATERVELPEDSVHIVVSPPVSKPEDQSTRTLSNIRRHSAFGSEVIRGQNERSEEASEAPLLTATGLGPAARAINGIQSPRDPGSTVDGSLDTATNPIGSTISSSPQLSLSIITKQRQDLQRRQSSQLHGLLPSMLPRLRSLTLTDVPCFDDSGQVINTLIQFIGYCASEAELAKLQVDLESNYSIVSHENGPRPGRPNVEAIFALRRITLEMSPPHVSRPSVTVAPGSPQTSRPPNTTSRTKSATEDADSEAFWAAQENDFSFFDDEEECGLPSVEPASRMPMTTISEKMTVPCDNNAALPTLQQPNTARTMGKDVVQALVKFRQDRKAAFEAAWRRGEGTVEGHWPGEVKVLRWQEGKTGMLDYYGNWFEKGYMYR